MHSRELFVADGEAEATEKKSDPDDYTNVCCGGDNDITSKMVAV
jgi:hypothetical protein